MFIHENLYIPSLAMIKFSILLFYARIFPGRRFRQTLYLVGAVVLLSWVSCQFAAIFACHPIQNFWLSAGPSESCIDVQGLFIGQAIPNIATDIVLLVLPLPLIWRLQLPLAQKLGLLAIFTLGSL